jgi:Flp pilus assembly protein TadD
MDQPGAYELFRQGTELLEAGDHHAATVPLARARELAPDKDSVREAYGRALFLAQRFSEAAAEFEAVVEHAPTNDYALFCLGRCLQQLGQHAEALHPLALAANLQPERADYAKYRDQARRKAA